MTHTKDTREAIAQIIEERAEIGVSGDAPLDPGVSNPEELADAILAALESAPSQAGGDVRELVEALKPFAREADEWEGSERTYDYVPLIGDVQDTEMSDAMFCLGDLRRARSLVAAAKNTPHVSGPMEPTEDMLIAGNAVMDEYANEQIDRRREVRDVFKAMLKAAPAALTATPAQRTPSGEVDGLVAEIDGLFEKATQGKWEVQTGCSWRRIGAGGGDGNVLCPTNSRTDNHPDLTTGKGEDLYANLELICALVNAWPRLRTALDHEGETKT